MPIPSIIIKDPIQVEERLESLNLSLPILRDTLLHIVSTRRGYTNDHPGWMIGISAAGEGIYMLRSLLRERGWNKEEDSGFELTVCEHREQSLALNIAKGTPSTGDELVNVETAYSKGIQTKKAIENNQLLLDLPPPPINIVEDISESAPRNTWYLLYHEENGIIKAELSLPLDLSLQQHISEWHERVILPEINVDDHTPTTIGLNPAEVVVDIKRKRRPS